MQLTYLIAWLLASPAWVCGQTIGHVTRDYFGDIFSLEDCEPCDESGRKAANIPGEKCRCQCAPSHYTFREDMKQCIKDVGECPVAMFVRPFAPPSLPPLGGFAERIPLVFLPMTGQLIHPGSYLTVSGITRLAPKHHLSCNVKASLLMTSHGWQPIRTPSEIFGVYYDGNKTFLQWLGDDEDRRHLQHHLVLIRLLCEGETSNGTFEPCAALRIGWAPGLEPELIDQSTNKNNFIIIGLCLGILGLIYVGAVLIYLKVRKNRRQLATRQGLAPSHNTIESAEEDSNSTQLRNAYINNLVQEAEFTTKSSPKGSSTHRPASDHDNGSSEGNHQSETSITQDTTHNKTNGKKCSHYENYSRTSADIPDDLIITSTQPPTQEFFVRIRGMISAAKNRLNSFRYRPTLLVIPEDDYFYQDFKERDEASGNRKTTFKKFNGKTTSSPITSKMESIHGSNLGAAMLEAKLAPPLPPPRNSKPKSKKRAPSPPGERISTPDYSRETPSPVSLKDFSNSMERKNGRITTVNSENYSKFDLFRLDLYEKINRMREGGSTENEIAVLEMNCELNRMKEDIYDAESASHHKADDRNGKEGSCRNLDYPPGIQDIKISRRQLLYKLETANMNGSDDEENDVESRAKAEFSNTKNGASNRSVKEDYEPDDDDDGVPSHVGSVIEDSVINEASITCSSRPGTAMSNSSARTTSSQPSTMKEKLLIRENSHPLIKRDDLSECSETSEASLSGDSLNSSFRKQVRSPSLLESRRSLKSTEDLSMISGSSVITSSTAIKEIEDYDDDDDDDEDPDVDEDDMTDITTQDDDSRFSTDLDAEIYSLDDSEHPSLEEYLQLSSQVAKKLSERTVPAFSNDSPREKNVISQFMKEFKTTIGRLKMAEDSKLRSMRTTSPGADNWTLKREETRAKVARRVSIFKRNPLKGRKNEEPLVTEDNGKSYYDMNLVSETDRDAASSRSSTASSLSSKRSKYKSKTPEIVPSAKVVDFTGDKTIISITNDTKGSIGLPERR
ncbi:uncharacterized protein LOC118181445 [Stegodyphus dumicola]|uniref:uncharacterized protein LOC118181445 n=1 Tax=Stegodyphus dumicola TaxID=202533 RepID=UPI0015AEBB5D|nr:uncharacterized protein LOC118181445 [Stegodyphus dumicola]